MYIIIGLVISIFLPSIILHRYLKNNRSRSIEEPHSKKNVLFCFAHPDDEVMFFSPTVMSLTRDSSCYRVFFLCLSTGNYDGLGNLRKQELYRSAHELGVLEESVTIIDHVDLQDGPRDIWKEYIVSRVVLEVVQQENIQTIITFDDYGVSGHCNHIAVYWGIRKLVQSPEVSKDLKAYQLESCSILRKYISVLDIWPSFLRSRDMYVNDWLHWKRAIRAMQQHQSQWVWFRRLYVIFSRFMVINTLTPIQVGTKEAKKEL